MNSVDDIATVVFQIVVIVPAYAVQSRNQYGLHVSPELVMGRHLFAKDERCFADNNNNNNNDNSNNNDDLGESSPLVRGSNQSRLVCEQRAVPLRHTDPTNYCLLIVLSALFPDAQPRNKRRVGTLRILLQDVILHTLKLYNHTSNVCRIAVFPAIS